MKPIKYAANKLNVVILLVVLSTAAVWVCGCGEKPLRVVPVPSRQVKALTADDIIQVMSRAGFSDEQIIEFGPAIRGGLLNSGAVQVRQGDFVEAVFAVNDNFVYVSTRMRGSFIYNTQTNGYHTGRESKTPQAEPAENGGRPADIPPAMKTSNTQNAPNAPQLKLFNC
jgi:hypothetical protein